MKLTALLASAATMVALSAGVTRAADAVTLVLNWVPTADHMPYFYAKSQGWYADAGLDVTIETGRGSAAAAQRVGAGMVPFGIADLSTVMVAKGQGADLQAVMSVYANSPQGFYWLKSKGISEPKDFAGRSIGNPPADASRVLWPVFAAKAGIAPDSVKFVNVAPPAKVASLKSGAIDITSDFYNEHDLKISEFGEDLGFVAWRDIGLNSYGNSLVVNGAWAAANPAQAKAFVGVTQKAFAACVADAAPCIEAIMAEASGLEAANQANQWNRIKELMADETTTTEGLGFFNATRVGEDYKLVESYLELQTPFDPASIFTNAHLDPALKMTAAK